jgi:hypothetical protein
MLSKEQLDEVFCEEGSPQARIRKLRAEVELLQGKPGLTNEQEAEIHKRLKLFLSKRDQGRTMGVIREVLG